MKQEGKGFRKSFIESLADFLKDTDLYKWLTRKTGKLANWQKLLLGFIAVFGFIFIIFLVANKIYYKSKGQPKQRT
jgi:hypothetical protein